MNLLKHRSHDDLVQAVAALNDQEWADLADEARQESLIPLAHLVLEGIGDSIEALASRLGAEVTTDDIGRRCVTRARAAVLITDRNAKAAAVRERAARERAEAKARPNPSRERVKALQRAHERLGSGLLRDPADIR